MKLKPIYALLTAVFVLAVGLASTAGAQTNRSARKKQVQIYFPKEGDSADLQNNPSNLQPVTRMVNPSAPLRPALEALLAGPTAGEKRRGFMEHDTGGIYIVKVAIKGDTAYASFAHRPGRGWSGDLSPLAFEDGVERTLKQFPNVRRTVICVDGLVNFADESGDAEIKCPNF
jgi:Sporulation and spore germination